MRSQLADFISFKLVRLVPITPGESNYIVNYNIIRNNILQKIEELNNYLKINGENAKKSFCSWIKLSDSLTCTITNDNVAISLFEISSIALRVLVLPGSEGIYERAFSQLKIIHSYLRNSFKKDILDSILRIKLKSDLVTRDERKLDLRKRSRREIRSQRV